MSKLTTTIKKHATAVKCGLFSLVYSAGNLMVSLAGGEKTYKLPDISGTDDASNVVKKFGSLAFYLFKCLGFVLLIWGFGQLVMAYRNDDSDSKVRAVSICIVGALLFGLQAIFEGLQISL